MSIKHRVFARCTELVSDKITLLQDTLRDLRESATNETKSTAGDKHETALAMLQIEQANTGRQLEEATILKVQLQKININDKPGFVGIGSLVETTRGFLFIGVALGKVKIEDVTVIVLSPQSPLGKKVMGLRVGNSAEMNGVHYFIKAID